MRRLLVLVAVLALLGGAAVFLLTRGGDEDSDVRFAIQRTLLERQIAGLTALLAADTSGQLLRFDDVLVTVSEPLVQKLLTSAMPYEYVTDELRVRVTSAAVAFREGLALVELRGRASLAEHEETTAFADLLVYGELEVVGLDPASGVLKSRIRIIGFDVPQVGVLGLSPPVRAVVRRLAQQSVEEFEELASDIEFPVVVESEIEMPPIVDDDVRIRAATLPLRATVHDVKAAARRLWVGIHVEILPETAPTAAKADVEPDEDDDEEDDEEERGANEAAVADSSAPTAGPRRGDGDAAAESAGGSHAGAPSILTLDPAQPDSVDTPEITALRARYAALHDSLVTVATRDTLLVEFAADSGDVLLGIRPQLVNGVLAAASAAYLDTVELSPDLEDEDIREVEDVEVDTPLGEVVIGYYRVNVLIQRVEGILSAGAIQVSFTDEDRLRIVAPARIVSGSGRATVRFAWDGKGIGGAACDDFQTSLEVTGNVVPRSYEVVGAFRLAAEGEQIVVRPEFPKQKVRIAIAPSRETWAKVRAQLEAIEDFEECSIGMSFISPKKLIGKLERLVAKGFKVKVPTKLIPVLELPAGVEEEVEVGDRRVRIVAHPRALRMTPQALWYSAEVDAALEPLTETAGAR